jgi:hypothetical protein
VSDLFTDIRKFASWDGSFDTICCGLACNGGSPNAQTAWASEAELAEYLNKSGKQHYVVFGPDGNTYPDAPGYYKCELSDFVWQDDEISGTLNIDYEFWYQKDFHDPDEYGNWQFTWAKGYKITSTIHFRVKLSSPYTSQQCLRDAYALLAYWNLADDTTYPWRTDQFTMIAPLVTRNEKLSSPDISAECGYVDADAATYDGSVRGAPLPAGYGPVFDPFHKTWKYCSDENGESHYIYAYGAWSGQANDGDATDAAIPKNAPQWTENYPAGSSYPTAGAWMQGGSEGARVQKWAEATVPRPSFNFARPCGEDRLRLDEETVRCVTATGTNNGNPTVTLLSATAVASNDLVYVGGVSGVADGFYKAVKLGDTEYELQPTGTPAQAAVATTSPDRADSTMDNAGTADSTDDRADAE